MEAEAKSTDYIADNQDGSVNESGYVEEVAEQGQELGEFPVTDGDTQSETEHVNWHEEARKWQSMYDKSQADKSKLEGAVEQYVRVQESQQANVQKPNNGRIALTEEEFNPWDAVTKPESKSYQFRAQQEDDRIQASLGRHQQQVQEQMVVNNTVNELKSKHNFNDNEVKDFMQFVTQPKENVPLGSLVKLFKDNMGIPVRQGQSSVETTRSVQSSAPRSAGVLNGQPSAQPKNEQEKMWDSIVSAGSRSNVLQ